MPKSWCDSELFRLLRVLSLLAKSTKDEQTNDTISGKLRLKSDETIVTKTYLPGAGKAADKK